MSRGPPPAKGIEAALPVARARGHVMVFRRERGSTADLMVSGSGILAIIRVQNAPRLYGSLAAIIAEFSDAIARLRLHPAGAPVSRELWLYSRYGVFRFFRVEDDGIVEIKADGNVLADGPVAPVTTGRSRSCQKKAAVPEQVSAGKNPAGPAACDKMPALPVRPEAGKSPGVPAPGCATAIIVPETVTEEGPGGGG
jgi:hypothetical protein